MSREEGRDSKGETRPGRAWRKTPVSNFVNRKRGRLDYGVKKREVFIGVRRCFRIRERGKKDRSPCSPSAKKGAADGDRDQPVQTRAPQRRRGR